MKRLISFIALIYCAMMAMAQYQDVKEKKAEGNRPLADFVNQQKVLWNFDWEFSTKMVNGQLVNGQSVNLPHDFQFEQPWIEDGSKARGIPRILPVMESLFQQRIIGR